MCKNHVRTYGIELEGYTSENIRGNWVTGWDLVSDGSLDDGAEECEYCNGNGTRERECQECYGSGDYECGDCEGYGDNECETCNGNGEVLCGKCDGYGEIDCLTCNGDGTYETDCGEILDCINCLGKGKITCDDCECSEYVECPNCEGNGRIDCEACSSNGRIDCEECSGNGYFDSECEECGGSGEYGDSDSGYGVECVSGIIDEGEYDSIDKIFNYIENYNWFVNGDCGTHVHIGASDLDEIDLSKLYILQNIIEPFIYGISPSDRIDGTFAKRTNTDMVNKLIRIGDSISLQEIANMYYGYSVNVNGCFDKYDRARYYGLNLHSWFYRRQKGSGSTIEFRYFEGCDDKEQAKAWIDLCVKLVDFAKYTTFKQLMVIGSEFNSVGSLTDYIAKVKELLDLGYNFTPYSAYAYDIAKRNIANCFNSTTAINRAV